MNEVIGMNARVTINNIENFKSKDYKFVNCIGNNIPRKLAFEGIKAGATIFAIKR